MSNPTTSTVAGPPADAALARAARILSGDVRPDDYLPVTPDVLEKVDGRFSHDRDERLTEQLLRRHHPEEHVAYIQDGQGVIVLATGLDRIGKLIAGLPGPWPRPISTTYTEPLDAIPMYKLFNPFYDAINAIFDSQPTPA